LLINDAYDIKVLKYSVAVRKLFDVLRVLFHAKGFQIMVTVRTNVNN